MGLYDDPLGLSDPLTGPGYDATGYLGDALKRYQAYLQSMPPAGQQFADLRKAGVPITDPRYLDAATPMALMFAGPSAATADLDALSSARGMVGAKNANLNGIWKDTGWGQGADKQWRFEIPDNTASLRPRASFTYSGKYSPYFQGNLEDALNHPELFNAYPDLRKLSTTIQPSDRGSGASLPPLLGQPGEISAEGRDPTEALSVVLHEIQHQIQDREGFARGSTREGAGGWDPYHRTAGEVEARNTETRRLWTPQRRSIDPPWNSEDVPRFQQILRYLNPPNPPLGVP